MLIFLSEGLVQGKLLLLAQEMDGYWELNKPEVTYNQEVVV